MSLSFVDLSFEQRLLATPLLSNCFFTFLSDVTDISGGFYCKELAQIQTTDSCTSAWWKRHRVGFILAVSCTLHAWVLCACGPSIRQTLTLWDLSVSAVYFLLNPISLSTHLTAGQSHASQVLLSKSAIRIRVLVFLSGRLFCIGHYITLTPHFWNMHCKQPSVSSSMSFAVTVRNADS